uniref:Uncharacterized protein n=1 Tax=Megaviridae environmental sample TaxID=1737588 RepID=A0A5J6VKI1_9VIRU|nr:MAG: hypothetical protein [Megaviridae environmental sample]
MSITLKLIDISKQTSRLNIGKQNETRLVQLEEQNLTLKILYVKLMREYNMNILNLKNVEYIHNGTKLNKNHLDLIIDISKNSTINILIKDTHNGDMFRKNIFDDVKKQINTEKCIEPTILNISEIKTNNNEHIDEYLSDEDFKYLLNIYINKPDLFNKLSNYVHSGNYIEKSEIEEADSIVETPELELLKKYNEDCNLGFSLEHLNNVLIHFKNQVNLTLRFLVNTSNNHNKE